MAKNTKIEWCDHMFNPWIGCAKVSPGCANCYAEPMMDKRLGKVEWGLGKARKRTSEANWNKVLNWERKAARDAYELQSSGLVTDEDGHAKNWRRPRVFCASLSDWLDPEVPAEWLADLLDLIRRTPNLDWLLLTKRPELWENSLLQVQANHLYWKEQYPEVSKECFTTSNELHDWCTAWRADQPPRNVWIGTSVEDQKRADERIPELLKIPARVRFLSCEPLLGPVDLEAESILGAGRSALPGGCADGTAGITDYAGLPCVDWVIAGGESGPHARPMHPDWARILRDQCREACVPFFFKQWGEWAPFSELENIRAAEGVESTCVGGTDCVAYKIGKKAAGRLLDGREWNETL